LLNKPLEFRRSLRQLLRRSLRIRGPRDVLSAACATPPTFRTIPLVVAFCSSTAVAIVFGFSDSAIAFWPLGKKDRETAVPLPS
jgi:hypothetical protein